MKEHDMAIDITPAINAYRECIRHLWNTYFLDQLSHSEAQWDISDEFDDICTLLFASLVMNPIGYTKQKKSPGYAKFPEPILCLQVVPTCALDSSLFLVNRENMKASGYWDHPITSIQPQDIDLRFIDFFDFDKLGYKECEYYLVRIADSFQCKNIIGRQALVKAHFVRILFIDEPTLKTIISKC